MTMYEAPNAAVGVLTLLLDAVRQQQ